MKSMNNKGTDDTGATNERSRIGMSTVRLEAVKMNSLETGTDNDIPMQPASQDIWDKKYRLKTKSGDAVDAEAVAAVGGDLDLEDRLAQRQHLAQRRARRRPVFEDDDPVRLLGDFELGGREDHPFGGDAPQLRLADLHPAGHRRPGQDDGDRLAGVDVGGAADDRPLAVAVADVDAAVPLIEAAIAQGADLDLDLEASVLIGDRLTDIEAGRAAGVGRCYLVGSGEAPAGLADASFETLFDCARTICEGACHETS